MLGIDGIRNKHCRQRFFCILLPLLVGFCTPSLVMLVTDILVGGTPPIEAILEMFKDQFSEGDNLFIINSIGLIPFIVLTLFLCPKLRSHPIRECYFLCACGLFGILALMAPIHFSVWYGIHKSLPGSSTSVIAFMFLPFICLIPMSISLFIGSLIAKKIWAKGIAYQRTKTSRMAIVSLVLAFASIYACFYGMFGFAIGVTALVLGIISIFRIRRNRTLNTGWELAFLAILISVVFIIFSAIKWDCFYVHQ